MGTNAEAVSEYRRNRKKLLVDYCGGKCRLCGYDKSIRALVFHHIDEATKEYGIAQKGTCHSIDKDIEEVHKTLLVCANCHAEIHDGFYLPEELYEKQFFDEKVVLNYKTSKEKTITYCIDCGKEISKGACRCEECNNKARRIVERPSRDELKNLIRNKSFIEIGKMYKVSDNAIRKWCITNNLPSKKKDIQSFSEEEWRKI